MWAIKRLNVRCPIYLLRDILVNAYAGFDGGDVLFSATRVSTLATALVNLLRQPEETKNRVLRIHDAITTQNQLLACAERLDSRLTFSKEAIDLQTIEAEAWAHYRNSNADPLLWVFSFINISIWSREELCAFHTNDNALLRVSELQGAELNAVLETEVAKAIAVFANPSSTDDLTDSKTADKAFEDGKSKLLGFVPAN